MKLRLIPLLAILCLAPAGAGRAADRPEDADFTDRLLPWSYFRVMAGQADVLVIDVREEFPGGPVPPGLETSRPIPLEIFLVNFVARGANRDRVLLVFDDTGETLPRVHRAFVQHGYEDFYFLAGGIRAVLKRPDRGS